MKRLALTNFSLRFPWLILIVVTGLVIFLGSQFSKVHFDNDPENMLAEDEAVRVFHHKVKAKFNLYDFVIVGIVNEKHSQGIFNVETLSRIDILTRQLLSLRPGADDIPEVIGADGEYMSLDLVPRNPFTRALNVAFRHDPNRLFNEDGSSAIIGRELIAPSVVDNIKQADFGSLKLEYLMEKVPQTEAEALVIRDDAMGNPLYKGTLVAEDEKAICIYIPITEKTYSYNVANVVRQLTKEWGRYDKVHITGLPVAEDTFGVEMLKQMATSAPLAGIAIFLLLLLFFKRVSLIIAPMLVAMVSVICTMGLLIGLGFDVHIMSSMIAIFLMPIAVADAVHILSEFFDAYREFGDKKKTLQHVVGHLFKPMLYTSLTTIAGFASLATTPIPPVRVFGLHVAFGVALAWLLTMTFVPAFITIFIPNKALLKLCAVPGDDEQCEIRNGWLDRFLRTLGAATYRRARLIIGIAVAVIAFSVVGVSRIQVNDNPVKWFTKRHPVRVADRVLNDHFGGTYTAYLTFEADPNATMTCREMAEGIRSKAHERYSSLMPQAMIEFVDAVDRLERKLCNTETCAPADCFVRLGEKAREIDGEAMASWETLADELNYLDPDGLTYASLLAAVEKLEGIDETSTTRLKADLVASRGLTGDELLDEALSLCDHYLALSFESFVEYMTTELTAPAFKRPALLNYMQELQRHLDAIEVVGKTSSAIDALKKAAYELQYKALPVELSDEEAAILQARNDAFFAIPDEAAAVGQVFMQLEGMKKRDSLFHLVTKNYQEANIWVQLTSGDNRDMQSVVEEVDRYMAANPPPIELEVGWAGLTYLNVVWQDKMVRGMFSSLISSFVVVLVMMMVLFRSPLYGLLAMAPLSLTILFIYGLIGWMGKDYDMPVAVLSSLTLGLSVDFAIHFLERAREERRRFGTWAKTCTPMFAEPAMAISRNAITISVGFTPLLIAPLLPYRTVGFFLATIMAVSWMATLLVLPALLTVLQKWVFREVKEEGIPHPLPEETVKEEVE
ncbi:MAG: MMPL family transporter [Kiritimatiellae bacterium]|nr:MMPL family transporter [Kiritimatiellia bacterium]